jgi:hypothetical protein
MYTTAVPVFSISAAPYLPQGPLSGPSNQNVSQKRLPKNEQQNSQKNKKKKE